MTNVVVCRSLHAVTSCAHAAPSGTSLDRPIPACNSRAAEHAKLFHEERLSSEHVQRIRICWKVAHKQDVRKGPPTAAADTRHSAALAPDPRRQPFVIYYGRLCDAKQPDVPFKTAKQSPACWDDTASDQGRGEAHFPSPEHYNFFKCSGECGLCKWHSISCILMYVSLRRRPLKIWRLNKANSTPPRSTLERRPLRIGLRAHCWRTMRPSKTAILPSGK